MPDQAIPTRPINTSFELAVRRIAGLGRVDAAPGVAVKHLRPLAEADVLPAEALRRIGVVPSDQIDWEIAILEYADAWSAMMRAER